jgi:hypothetical protein
MTKREQKSSGKKQRMPRLPAAPHERHRIKCDSPGIPGDRQTPDDFIETLPFQREGFFFVKDDLARSAFFTRRHKGTKKVMLKILVTIQHGAKSCHSGRRFCRGVLHTPWWQ